MTTPVACDRRKEEGERALSAKHRVNGVNAANFDIDVSETRAGELRSLDPTKPERYGHE
jgi:hypothetical protein